MFCLLSQWSACWLSFQPPIFLFCNSMKWPRFLVKSSAWISSPIFLTHTAAWSEEKERHEDEIREIGQCQLSICMLVAFHLRNASLKIKNYLLNFFSFPCMYILDIIFWSIHLLDIEEFIFFLLKLKRCINFH